MKTQDFGERVAKLYDATIGGKELFVAGHTPALRAVVIGNVLEQGEPPILYSVLASRTDITAESERLHVAMFQTDPAAREARWLTVGDRTRVVLHSGAAATRLVLPAGDSAVRYIVNGALLTPVPDMIPGMKPPQHLPLSLEALGSLLVESIPPPALRAVA